MKVVQLLVAASAACALFGVDAAKCTTKMPAPAAAPVATTAALELFPTVTAAAPTAASADTSDSDETENEADDEEVEGEADLAETDTLASSVDGSASSATASEATTSERASTNTTSSGHATFGKVKSAAGQCVIGDPTSYISAEYVDWEWDHRMSTYVPQFNNFIFDQLHTNKGSLSYCVRWDSTERLTKAVASKFEAMLNRQFKAWNQWLMGYNCWPFDNISVKVVGFAVRDASLLGWSDDSLGKIYAGVLDPDGIPQCPDECYKHRNFEASSDTSKCKGKPFDMSLWPTLGMGGGAGGDWGQRVDAASMLSTIDQDQLVIVAHEIGHGFGLPDFYEATDKPAADFPVCIMDAGTSMTVTPADGWMLRRVYEHISNRYK